MSHTVAACLSVSHTVAECLSLSHIVAECILVSHTVAECLWFPHTVAASHPRMRPALGACIYSWRDRSSTRVERCVSAVYRGATVQCRVLSFASLRFVPELSGLPAVLLACAAISASGNHELQPTRAVRGYLHFFHRDRRGQLCTTFREASEVRERDNRSVYSQTRYDAIFISVSIII